MLLLEVQHVDGQHGRGGDGNGGSPNTVREIQVRIFQVRSFEVQNMFSNSDTHFPSSSFVAKTFADFSCGVAMGVRLSDPFVCCRSLCFFGAECFVKKSPTFDR
jgi:hypothetical protein